MEKVYNVYGINDNNKFNKLEDTIVKVNPLFYDIRKGKENQKIKVGKEIILRQCQHPIKEIYST